MYVINGLFLKQAQQGEVKLIARSLDASYQAEIGYDLPATGLVKFLCSSKSYG